MKEGLAIRVSEQQSTKLCDLLISAELLLCSRFG